MSHPSRTVAAAVLAAAAAITIGVPALAQVPRPPGPSSTTTSTSSTSTTEPGGTATEDGSTTTTTAPGGTATGSGSTTTTTAPPPEAPPDPHAVPPEVQAMIDAYPRTPGRSTDDLLALAEPLADLRLKPSEYAPLFGRFPVAGEASYSHDWLFPRHVPDFHVHEGTDVFADRGTPVLAPAAGTVSVSNGSVGGTAVKVTQRDGTWWYLGHLDAVADGIEDGTEVVAGRVVGTVGDSGNAKGGSPHVHVEVHPLGGDPLDPKPLLDQYLDEAERGAPTTVHLLDERYGPWTRPTRMEPAPEVFVGAAEALTPLPSALGGPLALPGR